MQLLNGRSGLTVALFLLLFGFSGCNNKSDSEENEPPASASGDSIALLAEVNSNQSELFKTVLGENTEGVFRGVAFGETLAKVRSTETFEELEETSKYVGFTLDTPKLETIDVLYYYSPDNKLVNGITIDIFLNSSESVGKLWNECENYFSAKYGPPKKTNEKEITWGDGKVKLTLQNVSKEIDYGIKLSFVPATGQALAEAGTNSSRL